MHRALSAVEAAFNADIREFVLRCRDLNDVSLPDADLLRRWKGALIAAGWQAYKWPKAHGGTGWSPVCKYLWERACGEAALPADIGGMGIHMIGPILCGFGTADQQARYLPGILDGTVAWCQGYSEPGAGSDLAALRTSAVREGDVYRVNGQKIWTSDAHHADRMFCLTRTSSSGKKQTGITFLLLDMRAEGITVTPIIGLDGRHSLNRVTFDDVRVPVHDRIGEEGKGWTVAKGLLTHERTGLAFVAESRRKLDVLHLALRDRQGHTPLDDLVFRRKLDAVQVELEALETTELRTLAETAEGQAPGVQSSLLKLKGTLIVQRLTELLIEASGWMGLPYPMLAHELATARIGPAWCQEEMQQYLIARSASIAGGSDEVQRNIMAKQVLGL
jgi:alkylation response protein AidB-like acyl-CoA dehydrogenase